MISKRSFVYIISTAFCLILFPYITSVFAVELREISAIIAEALLKIAAMAVERSGTILTLGKMKFDIIPACNGSTTITVLFITSLILVVGNERLNNIRKLLCLVISIPIALLSNGIRLAILVYASQVKGEVIAEGFLHTAIGILGFLIGLIIIFVITDILTSSKKRRYDRTHIEYELFISSIVFALCAYLPFFGATIRDWIGTDYNKNDMFGYLFFIPGILLYIHLWKNTSRDRNFIRTGSLIFALSILSAASFQIINPNNYILGISFIISLFALSLMEKGAKFSLIILPSLIMIMLGYSKVTETINQLIGIEGFKKAIIIKLLTLAILFLITLILAYFTGAVDKTPKENNIRSGKTNFSLYYSLIAITSLLAVFLSIRGYTIQQSNDKYQYKLSYLMGDWIGNDITDRTAKEYFLKKKLISRIYQKNDQLVGLMIVPSDTKSSNLHTPEYCQQALNWKVIKSTPFDFKNSNGREIHAKKLLLKNRENIKRTFIYWFDDGNYSTGTYLMFVTKNSLQHIAGENKNWILNIVWSDTKNMNAINDFLSKLKSIKFTKK